MLLINIGIKYSFYLKYSNTPISLLRFPAISRRKRSRRRQYKTNRSFHRSVQPSRTSYEQIFGYDIYFCQQRYVLCYYTMIKDHYFTFKLAGKSFDEIIAAKFCISCGEKTAICPHKVTKEDMILRLPKRCTHIKVSRPLVRIGISISQQG